MKNTTYVGLKREFEKTVKILQTNCKHKKSKWFENMWAPGHMSGYKSEICNTCNKELAQKPTLQERREAEKQSVKEFFPKNKHAKIDEQYNRMNTKKDEKLKRLGE